MLPQYRYRYPILGLLLLKIIKGKLYRLDLFKEVPTELLNLKSSFKLEFKNLVGNILGAAFKQPNLSPC